MRTHVLYLNEAENNAVNLIAEGFSTRHIIANCSIPPAGYHIFCADIRRKTGVRTQSNNLEWKAYLERYSAAIAGERTTPEQTSALRRFVGGDTYAGIGYIMGIPEGDVEPLLDSACKAAAIFTRDDRARRSQARLYLAIFRPNYGPLSPTETRILRFMAEGKTFGEISELMGAGNPEEYLVKKAKSACLRLGFDAKGYNVQRNLLRAFFAYADSKKAPVTMDDPAF